MNPGSLAQARLRVRLVAALAAAGNAGLSCCELAAVARPFAAVAGNDARYGGQLGRQLQRRGLARPSRQHARQVRWVSVGPPAPELPLV